MDPYSCILGANGVPKNRNATIFKQLKVAFSRGIDMTHTEEEYEYIERMSEFVNSFEDRVKVEIASQISTEPFEDERDIPFADRILESVFAYVAGIVGV